MSRTDDLQAPEQQTPSLEAVAHRHLPLTAAETRAVGPSLSRPLSIFERPEELSTIGGDCAACIIRSGPATPVLRKSSQIACTTVPLTTHPAALARKNATVHECSPDRDGASKKGTTKGKSAQGARQSGAAHAWLAGRLRSAGLVGRQRPICLTPIGACGTSASRPEYPIKLFPPPAPDPPTDDLKGRGLAMGAEVTPAGGSDAM